MPSEIGSFSVREKNFLVFLYLIHAIHEQNLGVLFGKTITSLTATLHSH